MRFRPKTILIPVLAFAAGGFATAGHRHRERLCALKMGLNSTTTNGQLMVQVHELPD